MKISSHKCPKCGSVVTIKEADQYVCPNCGKREPLTEAVLDLRRRRYRPMPNRAG